MESRPFGCFQMVVMKADVAAEQASQKSLSGSNHDHRVYVGSLVFPIELGEVLILCYFIAGQVNLRCLQISTYLDAIDMLCHLNGWLSWAFAMLDAFATNL